MHFYPNERLAIFIDGANLYATSKALGFDIDYIADQNSCRFRLCRWRRLG